MRNALALLLLAPVALAAAVLVSPGCASSGPLAQPGVEFTKAARAMHDTLSVEYVAYVMADPNLTQLQKENRVAAVGDFDFMIRQVEIAWGMAPATPAGDGGDAPPADETPDSPPTPPEG